MNFKELKKFMKDAGWGNLATTDGKVVGVRPVSGWEWFGKEIWCATRKSSDKVKQLKKVSYAEYCFCDKEGRHVRLGGPSTISTDNDEKLKLYKSLPELAKYIQNPASPAYVVIKTKPKRIRFMAADDMEYKEVKIGS